MSSSPKSCVVHSSSEVGGARFAGVHAVVNAVRRFAIEMIVGLLRAYQLLLSPLLGANCRFEPSCSRYAVTALRRHGLFAGGWMAMRRLAQCHPWGGSAGYDPVP